jgi:hypothetical protein
METGCAIDVQRGAEDATSSYLNLPLTKTTDPGCPKSVAIGVNLFAVSGSCCRKAVKVQILSSAAFFS